MQSRFFLLAAVLAALSASCTRVPEAPEVVQPPAVQAPAPVVPAPAPVHRWPAPGTPDTPVSHWDRERWWATADLLVGLRSDQQGLEALDRTGRIRWELECGGKVNDLVWEKAEPQRAILFATEQGCLFDPATGEQLGTTPPVGPSPWLEGFAWRGELIAIGEDIKPPNPSAPPGAYWGTKWHVLRLRTGAEADLLYTAKDGSRMAALSQDGRTLFSWFGNHGAGRPRLFRDGELITTYERMLPVGSEFALDPRDDRFYLGTYQGHLQARSLEGQLLWEVKVDDSARPILWFGEESQRWIAVRHRDGFHVYDDRGALVWTGEGWPLQSTPLYLLVRHADGEMHLLNREGKVVARYPRNAYLTRDGKALLDHTGEEILLYPLP